MPLRLSGPDSQGNEKELGLQAFREGRWFDAVEYLEKALDIDPADVGAMSTLALAHDRLGDGKKARSILCRATETAPDFAETYLNLAVLLVREGRILEAADNACRALELDPSNTRLAGILERVRAQIRSLKPAGRKKRKKHGRTGGPAQADIDSRLARINSVLRKAAMPEQIEARDGKPTISLCTIAKDEEEFIDDCLKSVKGVVDEIVVVDTGSKDRTVEIAESHGAVVHRSKWTGSYSDARNESLAHAKCDWILVLDADERLDRDSKKAILRAVSNPAADGYALTFRNYVSSGPNPDFFTHRTCRLHRNRPEYRYVGRVHERIVPSISAAADGGTVANLDAVIHHYGYKPEMVGQRRKHERYVELLLADLKDSPGDPFCLYNLGSVYSTSEDFENALVYLEQAAKLVVPEHEFAAATFSRLAKALCKTGRAEEALSALERAELKGIRHPEISFNKGNALLLLGQYEKAIGEFLSAIRAGQSGNWIGDPSASGYKANYGIAQACMGLGDYNKAIQFCQKAISEKPDDADAHELLGAAYFNLGQRDASRKHLRQAVQLDPGNQKAAMNLADLYQAERRYQEAEAEYAELLESGYETPELRFKMAICMQASGKLDEAEENYLRAIEMREDYPQAHTGLGLLYSQQERAADALQCFARAVEIDPTCADAYFHAAELLSSMGKHQEAAGVYENGLSYSPGSAHGFLALGNCYFRLGAYDAAVMAYRQALNIRPDYPEAGNNLSLAEQALAQQKAA